MAGRSETIRRVRLGDYKRLLHYRYGYELPDDDAGLEDIELLLRLNANKNFDNVLEVWAPWLRPDESNRIVARVRSMPPGVRTPSPRELGREMRLTREERERLGIRQIEAFDVTKEQRIELRKAKQRANARKRRGLQSRADYLANSISKQKPWEAEGISRRTWYRRHKHGETSPSAEQKNGAKGPKQRGTSLSPINTYQRLHTCANATTSG